MNLETRVGRLEEEIGVNPAEPLPRKTIVVIFVDPRGPVDVHTATVFADFREHHFKRSADETLDDFEDRLGAVPWGRKNSVKVVFLWPDGDCEPVPRENAPPVGS